MGEEEKKSEVELDPVAQIEKRRAERKAAREKAQAEQYAKDVAQVDELEAEHGDDRVGVLETPSFVPGLPTLVVVLTPEEAVGKRYRQMVRKANGKNEAIGAAIDLLATSCVGYPDADTFKRMCKEWPALSDSVGVKAQQLGQAKGND